MEENNIPLPAISFCQPRQPFCSSGTVSTANSASLSVVLVLSVLSSFASSAQKSASGAELLCLVIVANQFSI